MVFHLTATGRHLPYGITQCYLPPDTSECAPPSPQPVGHGRYSIYLPRRDVRLSWPRVLGSAPAGNRTRDLSITSPPPYHYTNRADIRLGVLIMWYQWNCGRRKCEFSLSIAVPSVCSSPVALHIEIYTASRGFPATARLLLPYRSWDFTISFILNLVRVATIASN